MRYQIIKHGEKNVYYTAQYRDRGAWVVLQDEIFNDVVNMTFKSKKEAKKALKEHIERMRDQDKLEVADEGDI